MSQQESVAIANALHLEAARRHASPFRFNFDAMPSLKSLNLSIAVLLGRPTGIHAAKLSFLSFLSIHRAQQPRSGWPSNVFRRFVRH